MCIVEYIRASSRSSGLKIGLNLKGLDVWKATEARMPYVDDYIERKKCAFWFYFEFEKKVISFELEKKVYWSA